MKTTRRTGIKANPLTISLTFTPRELQVYQKQCGLLENSKLYKNEMSLYKERSNITKE